MLFLDECGKRMKANKNSKNKAAFSQINSQLTK